MSQEFSGGNNFTLIVGCPRSGTYLLSLLLSRHYSIAFPVETHFIPLFRRVAFLWGNLAKRKNRERLLRGIYDFLEIWMKIGHRDLDFKAVMPFSLLATRPYRDDILDYATSYSGLINNLFKKYAELHHVDHWGDKTVLFQHIPLSSLEKAVNNIKVVHIVRDGRDVCLSWRKTWFGPSSVAQAARLWVTHVKKRHEWGRHNPSRYIEVKYEDLLDKKDKVLADISVFLNLEHRVSDNDAYGNGMTEALLGPGTHQLLAKPIDRNNQEKWKTQMSVEDRELFEFIAGDTLSEFGYSTEKKKPGFRSRLKIYFRIYTGELAGIICKNYFQRRLKVLLPIALYFADIAHISLSRWLTK